MGGHIASHHDERQPPIKWTIEGRAILNGKHCDGNFLLSEEKRGYETGECVADYQGGRFHPCSSARSQTPAAIAKR